MPQYDYRCNKCEHEFLRVLRMDNREEPLSEPCPECEEEGSIHRVYTTAGTIDIGILKADKRMEDSGVQSQLERIRDQCNPNMTWKG